MSSEMLPSIRYQVGTATVENLAQAMKLGASLPAVFARGGDLRQHVGETHDYIGWT